MTGSLLALLVLTVLSIVLSALIKEPPLRC